MEDLISRQAAIDALENNRFPGAPYVDAGISIAINKIKEVPSAQPERKKGRWYDVGSLSCRCSECGCKSPKEYSFCPNCGAEMEGVDEQEALEDECSGECDYCPWRRYVPGTTDRIDREPVKYCGLFDRWGEGY